MFPLFDFDKTIDIASEILIEEAVILAEKILKKLSDLPLGTKIAFIPRIRSARDLIVLGLALKIARHDIKEKGKTFNVRPTSRGWVLEILPSRKRVIDGLNSVEDILFILKEIVRLWGLARKYVDKWIEMYLDFAPQHIINRLLRVFEHMDQLGILLTKIENER